MEESILGKEVLLKGQYLRAVVIKEKGFLKKNVKICWVHNSDLYTSDWISASALKVV